MKNFRNIIISALMLAIIIINGCNGCNNSRYKHPRTSKIVSEYPVKVERFDKELFALKPENLHNGLIELKNKYGIFYTSYARDIMRMQLLENDSLYEKPMRMLLGFERLQELAETVDSAYEDLSDIEKELSKAMGIYHAEFPKAIVPRFISFISEFGNGNVIYDSMICIGLDFYMNKRFNQFYVSMDFPSFMIAKMQRNYIVPNAIKALAIGQYDYQTSKDKRFIAQILLEGKIRYFMKSLLPTVNDTIIMGYTQSQLDWCKENETQIWTHFIDKNMLYESDPGKFMRYLNDGPFTVAEDVPRESSPAIGAWMGWQIINHYMANNPKVTLHELMDNTNFEDILKQSKYRPK